MSRLIPAVAIVLGWAASAWAAAPGALTTLRAIHALTNAEASKDLPVDFEATVTYYRGYERTLFVEDDGAAIYVNVPFKAVLAPGDRVRIEGITRPSFNPLIEPSSIVVLRHGALPRPVPATFDQLIHGQQDCMLVRLRGVVRAAGVVSTSSELSSRLKLMTDGGPVEVNVDSKDANAIKNLLDAEVDVTGAVSGFFDGKMEKTGVMLHTQTLDMVKVLKRGSANLWLLPVTPIDKILSAYHVKNLTQRVRVHGIITYYQPGASVTAVVLQDGSKSVWIDVMNLPDLVLHIGNLADATGFPVVQNGFLSMTDGDIRDNQISAPVAPPLRTWQQLSTGGSIFDLVSIEGQVVTQVREGNQDEYVLRANDKLFSATFAHPSGMSVPPMKQVPLGSRVRVTGICILSDANPWDGQVPFKILLRTFDDVTVVARPPLLNIRNLMIVVGLLLVLVFAVLARGWTLERKVRRQTTALARIEQRRGRILEDINGARPLAEIVEEIAELGSFKLHGAPCWCQIADGARLGNCPPDLSALRIVQQEIPARSGPPLGTVYAAFDPLKKPSAIEPEALSMTAGLATLAIEIRGLYSDLLHRSEFDLLTDIHNRFSLEKQLDAQMEEARQNAGVFGLIYIDLDEFKQVNDLYGHHVGDLYLQEVAWRMKQQLRSHDLLARLGGDEFAVLLPQVRNRAGVEEIALRLEHCFDTPFAVAENFVHGSASIGIALYPEDSAARNGLLSAADAAMYVAKNAKRRREENPAQKPQSQLAPQRRS